MHFQWIFRPFESASIQPVAPNFTVMMILFYKGWVLFLVPKHKNSSCDDNSNDLVKIN